MLNQFFSPNKEQKSTIGANSHIQSQLHSLEIERDILTKTISRLYDNDSGLSKIQRDRLLLRYQHQLGIVIARIEKLETVSKHPDLGPLGEGLITLMDQKLSQLDQRLYELTSKIQLSQNEKVEQTKKENQTNTKPKENIHKPDDTNSISQIELPRINNEDNIKKKFEITTLTSVPKLDSHKQTKYDEMLSQLDSDVITPPPKRPKIDSSLQKIVIPNEVKPEISHEDKVERQKPILQLPEDPDIDDDDDDLEKMKSNIMKTLSKIDQAEVD